VLNARLWLTVAPTGEGGGCDLHFVRLPAARNVQVAGDVMVRVKYWTSQLGHSHGAVFYHALK